MPTRPVECPACGHEGISRSSSRFEGRVYRGQAAVESWTCRLCAYSWTRHTPGRRPMEGPDVARP